MIEAFIEGRKMLHTIRGHLDRDMGKVQENISKKIAAAADTAMEGDPVLASSFGVQNGKLPSLLPSPSSATSTPANRDGGTPPAKPAQRPGTDAAHIAVRQQEYKGSVPFKLLPPYMQNATAPIPTHVMTSMMNCTEGINSVLVRNLKDLTSTYSSTAHCISIAQTTLNLPVLRRCFPKTWSRIIHTTLLPTEEHEPDIEDEEGELYWPDNCINGEGIGWVCLLGKAMIKEYGKAYGYMSVDGAVPKPEVQPNGQPPPHTSGHQSPAVHSSQPPSHRPSVPSGAPR